MTESKIDSFNIEPLVFEIENVIKNGLRVVLKDYMNRYELLEKTHKQIMKLPSVINEINKGCDSDSDSDSEPEEQDKTMFVSIKDMTQELVKKEISYVESKLDRIEKKYESISPLISKILDKLESINDEVKVLKENSRDNIKIVQMESEKPYISNIIKPSIVSACENENIKFEIDEDECEESDEEDDVNPALITCSNISIKKEIKLEKKEESDEEDDEEVEIVEPVEVKKEVIVIEEEEEVDDELSVGQELGEHEPQEETMPIGTKIGGKTWDGEEFQTDNEEETEEVEDTDEVEEDEVETEASDEEEEEEEETEVETTVADKKEEEEELEIITIDDIDYCTNDMENGFIWELSEDGEQGDKVGYLKEGEPFFYADEK